VLACVIRAGRSAGGRVGFSSCGRLSFGLQY
jgi:hypothetical protein